MYFVQDHSIGYRFLTALAMNLFSIIEDSMRRWSNDTALIHDGRRLSYGSLYDACLLVGDRLRDAGIGPGDKVCILFPRSAEYIIACFAVLRIGAIAVPLSGALKPGEIASLAADTKVDAFCCASDLREAIPPGFHNPWSTFHCQAAKHPCS